MRLFTLPACCFIVRIYPARLSRLMMRNLCETVWLRERMKTMVSCLNMLYLWGGSKIRYPPRLIPIYIRAWWIVVLNHLKRLAFSTIISTPWSRMYTTVWERGPVYIYRIFSYASYAALFCFYFCVCVFFYLFLSTGSHRTEHRGFEKFAVEMYN